MNDLLHIMMIEFSREISGKEYEFVALYNENVLTEKEVLQLIHSEQNHLGCLIISKAQWNILFKNKLSSFSKGVDDNELGSRT